MFTIIIVSYNSDKDLNECIKSIMRYNDLGNELQIIVIDNARSIKTKSIIESYSDITYVENSNLGFGHANNVGALLAKNDFLLFLNPDTLFIEPILNFAVKQFSTNKDLRAFGMLLVDEKGAYQETFGFFPEALKLIPEKYYLPFVRLGYSPPNIFPWGANIFVRKEDFFAAGMFDEKIFMCYEEPDLIHRLPKGQVKIFPKRIIHKAGHTTGDIVERYKLAIESEKYYFSKHGLDYLKYLKRTLNIIGISIFLRKLFFVKSDRQFILRNLYKRALSSLKQQ